jgi:hypothetical protein
MNYDVIFISNNITIIIIYYIYYAFIIYKKNKAKKFFESIYKVNNENLYILGNPLFYLILSIMVLVRFLIIPAFC